MSGLEFVIQIVYYVVWVFLYALLLLCVCSGLCVMGHLVHTNNVDNDESTITEYKPPIHPIEV